MLTVLTAALAVVAGTAAAACIPNTTSTAGLQAALDAGGAGFVLSLCPGETYSLAQALSFASPNQEISTAGYPPDDSRAILRVVGNDTAAVLGVRAGLDGAALRYVQVDGNRGALPPVTGDAAIKMGGDNSDQVVEHVRVYDPRSWSCLHIAEGSLRCSNATVQYNAIGPCGAPAYGAWADGISLACRASAVRYNTVRDATDGGVVVFGAPGSVVANNTIVAATRTMLGGINLVDVVPWAPGNYTHTAVLDNVVAGGFAPDGERTAALVKIGVAVGPRVWFGDKYARNTSTGGVVARNVLRGAFTFGIVRMPLARRAADAAPGRGHRRQLCDR
ncbi:hypothetical protein VHUM_00735 [Vanrija humicola]|uniref:Uncharacterized protein n=1 Tax=Vanrija humicola TaxID=5417 RepID=A0A7D8Z1Y1_VANHU|nr:hypothetical protein VHUM_00735 [Vanrija humicola]